MWNKALLFLCLALSGCAGFDWMHKASSTNDPPPAAAADSAIMRRVMGEDVLDQPLVPQPGNIWADVLPAAEPGPQPATSVSAPAARRPDIVAVAHDGSPHALVPVVAAAAPRVLTPAVVAKAAPPATFGLMVQLAAAASAERAEAEWRRLRQHAPTLTDGHQPAVSQADVNGRQVWRLRTAGFTDVAQASAFCVDIRAVKADCWVVPPAASP